MLHLALAKFNQRLFFEMKIKKNSPIVAVMHDNPPNTNRESVSDDELLILRTLKDADGEVSCLSIGKYLEFPYV